MLSARRWSRHTAVAVVGVLVVAGSAVGAAPAGAAVRYCQGQQVTIEATASDTTVTGTAGSDVIDGAGRLRLVIEGLGGDDVICTGPGFGVVVRGGEGDDSLESGVVGGSGPRTELYGEAGDDVVRLAGDPNFDGSSGADTLADGGDGNDQLIAEVPYAKLVPGPGDDVVTGGDRSSIVFGGATGVRIDVPGGVADGEGHDIFTRIRWFIGSPGPDVFIGSERNDSFGPPFNARSDQSADVATGGGGNDVLAVTRGRVDGGDGEDVLSLRGAGTAIGGAGDDTLLVDDAGTARGGSGADSLTVTRHKTRTAGVARLFGDGGDDQVLVRFVSPDWSSACSGPSACRTRIDAGAGRDLLTFDVKAAVRVDLRSGRASHQSARLGVRGVEDVAGTRYADALRGDGRSNYLRGKAGNDVLSGRAGADRLRGGSDRDRVDGGPGRDSCQGEVRRSC